MYRLEDLRRLRELERRLANEEKTLDILEEQDYEAGNRYLKEQYETVRELRHSVATLRLDLNESPGETIVLPASSELSIATFDFQRVLADLSRERRDALFQLTARQFEELVAELWQRFGYDVELTSRTRDGGRDIVAVKAAETNLRFLIECKRYNPERPVDVRLVRQLYGVKTHEGATKAILATTSYFTAPAQEFFEAHWWELESRDLDGVLEWVKLATVPRK